MQSHIDSISMIDEVAKKEAAKECGDDACTSCKDGTHAHAPGPQPCHLNVLKSRCLVVTAEACGKFECLWDDEDDKGCGPRYVSLFGHKIDLLEVKERSKQQNKEL